MGIIMAHKGVGECGGGGGGHIFGMSCSEMPPAVLYLLTHKLRGTQHDDNNDNT